MTRLEYELRKVPNGDNVLAAYIGKTDTTIRNFRLGSSVPRLDDANKICEYFTSIGVYLPVSNLLDEVDENGNKISEPEQVAH